MRGSPWVGRLEWDVFVGLRRGRIGAWPIAEQAKLPGHDLGAAALSASVLGFVLAGSKPAFDVDLPAFAQKPLAVLFSDHSTSKRMKRPKDELDG